MDMSISLDGNNTFNIRIAAVCSYNDFYVVDDSNNGYVFHVGGKLKYNETIYEAITREISEELGIITKPTLVGFYESFFLDGETNIHEHLFLFTVYISNYSRKNKDSNINLIKKNAIHNYLVYPKNWERALEQNEEVYINTTVEKQMYMDRNIEFIMSEHDSTEQKYKFIISVLICKGEKSSISGVLHFGETLNEGLIRIVHEKFNCTIKRSFFGGFGEDFFTFENNKQIRFLSAAFAVELNE